MKVLFLHSLTGIGGGERMLEDIVGRLSPGVECRVVLPGEGELTRRLEQRGVRVDRCEVPMDTLWGRLPIGHSGRGFAQVARVAREFSPDVIHLHISGLILFGLAASSASGAPVLLMAHLERDQKRWPRRALQRLTASRILTVSNRIRNLYRGHGSWFASNTFTLYPGVETAMFSPAEDTAAARVVCGLPSSGPIIIIIGRFHPLKAHDVFFDSAELVLQAIPDATFLVVGDTVFDTATESSDYAESVRARARESALLRSRVVFAGFAADVRPWLRASDILVCSSESESFGVSVVEAMACGVPVVSTACGGPEEIVDDGKTGYLVPVGDSRALAARVVELAREPALRSVLGQAARARALAVFGLDRYIESLLRHYTDLLEGRRP